MNTYNQVSLLIDFVRQNSEFADQFDPSRIDLNGKTRIDKNRKQVLYCKQSAKGWITANLFDIWGWMQQTDIWGWMLLNDIWGWMQLTDIWG